MADIREKLRQLPQLQLDWRAYFLGFCEAHGDPLPFEGRLLFPDGWTYSDRRYEGPEWPPPEDPVELKRITLWYWKLRKMTVSGELAKVREMVNWVKQNQQGRGARLQYRAWIEGEQGQGRFEAKDLDPLALELRQRFLEDDLAECESKMKELTDGPSIAV